MMSLISAAAALPVADQVDLYVGGDEAPFGGVPVGRRDDDGMGPLDLAIEPLLPVVAHVGSVMLVEIEEGVAKASATKPILDPPGFVFVATGM